MNMSRLIADAGSKTSSPLKPVKLIRKKPETKGVPQECFVCRLCLCEIAGDEELLSRLELNVSFGLFRRLINVIGFIIPAEAGRYNFLAHVYCLRCNTNLGALLLRVGMPYLHGEHWVAGNYWMIMPRLLIRRGNSLLDAATRQVVGNI